MGMFKWLSRLFNNEAEIERPANVIREPISVLRVVPVKPADTHDEPAAPASTVTAPSEPADPHEPSLTNPATGQPMMGGMGGVDILGNPYGVDLDDGDGVIHRCGSHHSGGCDDTW